VSTIKDVARLSGVSIATVSRYLNSSGYVGEKTRAKIDRIIEELNYQPLQSARMLKTKKSNVIAFIIPTLRNNFFVELASFIEKECLNHGYKMILCNIDENPELETSYLEMITQHNLDGVILSTGSELHKKLENKPLVLLDRVENMPDGVSVITSNHKEGAMQAVRHLVQQGCKKILHVRPEVRNVPALLRQEGYEEGMKEAGLTPEVFQFLSEEEMYAFNYEAYDGLFTWNDMTAIELLFHLKKSGRRIPEDIKIVGFDNNFMSSTIYPSLTTIDQPYEKIAEEAVKAVIEIIKKGRTKRENCVLPTQLIIRETTEVRVLHE